MLFRISLIFLICLVWFRYFISSFWLSLSYTILATTIIEIALHFILKKRKEKEFLKASEEALADKIATSFAFNGEEAIKFFNSLAKSKHKTILRSKYIIIPHIEKTEEGEEIEKKTILYPSYSLSIFMPQDLVSILNKLKKVKFDKIVICAKEVSRESILLSNQITDYKVLILDKNESYKKLLKAYNIFPENLMELKTTTKMKIKEIVAFSLNKKRSKGYFLASVVLLLSSFFFRLNLYYVIMSSILLLLSLISFVLPKYNLITPDEIL